MRLIAELLTATFLSLPALAQEAPIRETIGRQIDAFVAQDFGRAFTFASPTIKGIFGSPENFGSMVAQGYPMLSHPSAIRMLDLRNLSGQLWQKVMITDQQGRIHLLDYQMIETESGWQINAVHLLPAPDVGV